MQLPIPMLIGVGLTFFQYQKSFHCMSMKAFHSILLLSLIMILSYYLSIQQTYRLSIY